MIVRMLTEYLRQDAIHIRKFIKDNAKPLKKTDKGVGTKFFLR